MHETAAKREQASRAAFEVLRIMVRELLNITEGDKPIDPDAVPHLKEAVEAFHKLSNVCDDAVIRMGQEFVDTPQYGGENKQFQNKIQDFINRLDGDIQSQNQALERASQYTRQCYENFRAADRQLDEARNKKDVSGNKLLHKVRLKYKPKKLRNRTFKFQFC